MSPPCRHRTYDYPFRGQVSNLPVFGRLVSSKFWCPADTDEAEAAKKGNFGSHGPKWRFFLPSRVFAALMTDLSNWGAFFTERNLYSPPKF
jgi:hypothetical protein